MSRNVLKMIIITFRQKKKNSLEKSRPRNLLTENTMYQFDNIHFNQIIFTDLDRQKFRIKLLSLLHQL